VGKRKKQRREGRKEGKKKKEKICLSIHDLSSCFSTNSLPKKKGSARKGGRRREGGRGPRFIHVLIGGEEGRGKEPKEKGGEKEEEGGAVSFLLYPRCALREGKKGAEREREKKERGGDTRVPVSASKREKEERGEKRKERGSRFG